MKNVFIANWKANKTIHESSVWIKEARNALEESGATVIICPDFVSIPVVASLLTGSYVKVGSQDISSFGTGAYTGEVVLHSLENLIQYTLVGHSERRRYFNETTASIISKVVRARSVNVTPIVCMESVKQCQEYSTHKGETRDLYFAYEPVASIGNGKPEPLESAQEMLEHMRDLLHTDMILYGGSVNSDVVSSYIKLGFSGVLVGTASLDSAEFVKIVTNGYLNSL